MLFSKNQSITISYEDIDIVLCKWNLQRIRLICILTLMMQLVNIFDSGVQATPYLLFATIALTVLSLGYFIYYHLFFEKIKESKRITNATITVFWILYVVCNTFFCARDAEQQRTPLSFLICIVLLTVVPIMSTKRNLFIFGTTIFLGIVSSMQFNAGISYYLYLIIFALSGIIFSNVISKNYVSLIKELNKSSTYDSLTSLFNRSVGIQRGGALYEFCKRDRITFAVIMCDIDNFKAINDKFGHQKGDEILARIASSIQSTFKRKQDVVCRLGGEEFAVFCIADSEEAIQMLTYKLVTTVHDLKMESGSSTVSPYVTISAGYTCCRLENENSLSLDELISQADMAMYTAKASGKNNYVAFAEKCNKPLFAYSHVVAAAES